MNVGNFPIFVIIAFLAVALLTPAVSLILLKRKRDSTVDISSGRSLTSVFFTELFLWVTIVLVVGVLLIVLLAIFAISAGHGRVANYEPVPLLPIIIILVILAGLALVGFVLHDKAKMMLIGASKAQSNNSLNRSAG
ncbi:MAG TPA: hypothetical protein VFQ47_01145 [Nitrososphaera sp.]|nr:hypothetical protein [Nitrososphaera sp.]